MPVYDFNCPKCRWSGELFGVSYEKREKQKCPECKTGLGHPAYEKPPAQHGPGYQMKAVMSNGDHVKGHFGKEAKRRKK